ncbi:unnamed protein product, partial [Durusdinium trenchii]
MALGRSTSMALSQVRQQPKLMSGAKYFNEDLDSLMQKGPEAAESVQMDLAALKEEEEAYAVLLWNHDSHKLLPFGATQREVLARVVRWWEGFLEMPVRNLPDPQRLQQMLVDARHAASALAFPPGAGPGLAAPPVAAPAVGAIQAEAGDQAFKGKEASADARLLGISFQGIVRDERTWRDVSKELSEEEFKDWG